MADGSKAQVLSLADDSGPLVVKRGVLNMRVEFNSCGTADVYTNIPVTVHPAANDSAVSGITPQIGDLDDGGVYVGKSATTGKDLHAALADEPEYLNFDEASEAAEKLRKRRGRENAHVPTPEELDKNLFDNRNKGALKGTFNTSGSFPASCYRSSAPSDSSLARVQWFDGGFQYYVYRDDGSRFHRLPVRLVW